MAWNNKRQGNKPNSGIQPFWVTCKSCKEKLSVPADWVFKYLERIGYDIEPKEQE